MVELAYFINRCASLTKKIIICRWNLAKNKASPLEIKKVGNHLLALKKSIHFVRSYTFSTYHVS
jgi:hypothetical protein